MKENRRMSTCDRLDLPTLGFQPVIVPKNLPNHCSGTAFDQDNARSYVYWMSNG